MANDVMIEVKGLSKWYGAFRALDRVHFDVRRGEVVGFLGPNGAGKSTTMRILTCFISATSGSARVHGKDIFEDSVAVRSVLGYLPQRAPLYGEMTVWDYLRFCSEMRGLDYSTFKSRMKRIVEVCGLAKVLGKDIRTLSHGYRQRVGLGQALVHDPPILILDEPTSDLDPNEKAQVIRYIQEIGKNRTVLLSTHNLNEVEAACARAIIVSKGRVVADGNLDEIRAKSGKVRYVLTFDEKKTLNGGRAPIASEVASALRDVRGVSGVKELPTDDRSHTFELKGALGEDLRAELYRFAVDRGWLMLELRRETQTLEDVFKALTRGDERADRGFLPTQPLPGEEEEEDDDEYDDEDDDEDEDEAAAKGKPAFTPEEETNAVVARGAKAPAAPAKKGPAREEEEEEEEEDEDDGEEEEEGEEEDSSAEDEQEEDEQPSKKKGSPTANSRTSKKD